MRALVALKVEQRRVGHGLLADLVVDLVAVEQPVHQALGQGLLREERAAREQRRRLLDGQPAAGRDRRRELLGHGLGQPRGRLPGRAAEAGLGELVGGRLVLVPLGGLEVDAELLQRAVQEDLLDGDAGEAERARGLQVDPVEPGGQEVGHVAADEVAERLRPGDRELSRPAELEHRVAQFLDLGEPDPRPADLDHQRAHPVIGRRPLQPVEQVGQPRAAYREKRGHRVLRAVRQRCRPSGQAQG